jgi:hypothetical protein
LGNDQRAYWMPPQSPDVRYCDFHHFRKKSLDEAIGKGYSDTDW